MKKISLLLATISLLGLVSCSNPTNPTTIEPTETNPTTSNVLLTGEIPEDKYLYVGDKMYDFSFTNIDGELVTLSEELNKKEVVVINFFASWCAPCIGEFPAMQSSYEKHKDDVSLIALTVERTDSVEYLKTNFKEKFSTTFYIGSDEANLCYRFFGEHGGNISIPLSVVIDKNGIIAETHFAPLSFEHMWDDLYAKYLEDGDSSTNKIPTSEEIKTLINDTTYNFGYYNPEDKNNYPWLISEEQQAIYPSNSLVDDSYSIIKSDFEVTDIENNVLVFDYLSSTEKYDVLYVKINDQTTQKISGVSKEWKSICAFIPESTGTYTLTLMYEKDSESKVGDDLVYVKNMRFVNINEVTQNS